MSEEAEFVAYLEELLEAERENVRVLREALNRIIDRAGSLDSARLMCDKALATTAPEAGTRHVAE